MSGDESPFARYERSGLLVVPDLVSAETSNNLTQYLLLLSQMGMLTEDERVVGSGSVYGDPLFDALLEFVRPTLSALLGLRLLPTYSFTRLYLPGNELVPHRDRGSCEHSVTVHLGADEQQRWPIWVRSREGDDVAVELNPGDGLCYLGRELTHWRTPFTGTYHAQIFLHYVDADGPDAHHALDGRDRLGVPMYLVVRHPASGG